MKRIIFKIIIWALTVSFIIVLITMLNNAYKELDISATNFKALVKETSIAQASNIAYKLHIDQLNYIQDSIMIKMKEVLEENKIKDKNISNLQYQLEHFYKRDTIILRDTIFKDPGFKLDTCIRDDWNTTCLSLSYPGNIGIESSYKNEKFIIVNSKREPIKPSNCKFVNFFRKKHTILEIDVIDKNPYVETKKQRFIEIIK